MTHVLTQFLFMFFRCIIIGWRILGREGKIDGNFFEAATTSCTTNTTGKPPVGVHWGLAVKQRGLGEWRRVFALPGDHRPRLVLLLVVYPRIEGGFDCLGRLHRWPLLLEPRHQC